MLKQIAGLKAGLVLLLGALLLCSGCDRGKTVKWEDNRGNVTTENTKRDNEGNVTVKTTTRDSSGDITSSSTVVKHYYRDGRWYARDTTGNERSVADIVIGAIAAAIPPQSTTVVYQDTPYYYDNRHYYRQLSDGSYVVVEPPRR